MSSMKRTEYGYVCPIEERIDQKLETWLTIKQLSQSTNKALNERLNKEDNFSLNKKKTKKLGR